MHNKILTVQEIAEIVKPIAEKYGIRAVYLYGSYARGTADADSDIDLVVDTTGTALTSLFALGALYSELSEALGKEIDLITLSSLTQTPQMPSEIGFRDNVEKEKVSLYAVA
ncbi:MAG: nucleotidyltransferase domain-containing protein [Oscillospiraceae bacterium]|nr:nucleotidyltransferase domain-containing protein [Oscillospiraceae bacterium]